MKYFVLLFAFVQANAMMMPMDGPGGFPRHHPMGPLFVPPPPPLGFPGSLTTNSLESSNSPGQIFMNIFQTGPRDNPSVQPEQFNRLQSELSRMQHQQMSNEQRMFQLQMENNRLRDELRNQNQKPHPHPTSQPIPSSGPVVGPAVMPAVITPHQMPIPSSGPKGPSMPPTPPGMVSAAVMPHQMPSSGPKGPMPPMPPTSPGMVSAAVMPHQMPSSGPKGPMPPQPMASAFSAPGAQARHNQFPGGFAPQH